MSTKIKFRLLLIQIYFDNFLTFVLRQFNQDFTSISSHKSVMWRSFSLHTVFVFLSKQNRQKDAQKMLMKLTNSLKFVSYWSDVDEVEKIESNKNEINLFSFRLNEEVWTTTVDDDRVMSESNRSNQTLAKTISTKLCSEEKLQNNKKVKVITILDCQSRHLWIC